MDSLNGENEGGKPESNFEPLMSAFMEIVSNAMDAGGLEVMTAKEDGSEGCPICFMKEKCKCGAPDCKERYEGWLTHAADDQLNRAKALGLITPS